MVVLQSVLALGFLGYMQNALASTWVVCPDAPINLMTSVLPQAAGLEAAMVLAVMGAMVTVSEGSVIDIHGRVKALRLLNAILTTGISNHQLDDEWPSKTLDRGLSTIGERIWCFYPDLPEKIVTQADLNSEQLDVLNRCIIFVKTSEEYVWPPYSFETENIRLVDRVLGRSEQVRRREWGNFISAGDISAWPFLHIEDYENASRSVQSPPNHADANN
ncbi:MAG: hypothetical protein V1929_04520 [bacterium]